MYSIPDWAKVIQTENWSHASRQHRRVADPLTSVPKGRQSIARGVTLGRGHAQVDCLRRRPRLPEPPPRVRGHCRRRLRRAACNQELLDQLLRSDGEGEFAIYRGGGEDVIIVHSHVIRCERLTSMSTTARRALSAAAPFGYLRMKNLSASTRALLFHSTEYG